jgi:hypothetical protein
MADLLARRGFLRQLAGLPLIGGVTILGKPTKAAVPVTEELKERYIAWLAHEHRGALWEREVQPYPHAHGRHPNTVPMYWFPEHPDIELVVHGALPSTRAAVVLSAVGCGGQRSRFTGR